MKRLSAGEKWLLGLTPLLLIFPLTLQRWQQFRASQVPVVVWEHTGRANSVAFSPDSLHLVTAGGELNTGPEVRVWNVISKAREAQFKGNGAAVMSLDARFSPDGTRILGIKGDGLAEQWNWRSGNWIGALGILGAPGAPVWGQARTPNGRPSVWKPTVFGSLGRLMSADYSPDGQTVVTCGYLSSKKGLWDANTGVLIKTFTGDLEPFSGVRFSPNGKHFLSVRAPHYKTDPQFSTGYDANNLPQDSGRVDFWEVPGAKRLGQMPVNEVVYAAWSPDGKRVAIARKTATVKRNISNSSGQNMMIDLSVASVEIWQVNWTKGGVNFQKLSQMSGNDLISALDWSPDGKMLVGYHTFEGAIIWKANGEEVRRFSFQKASPVASAGVMNHVVAWSPNGRWIAAVNGPRVELWDATLLKTNR